MEKTTETMEAEALANDVYDKAMSGEFHSKTGLKIIPLLDYIRGKMELARQEGEKAGTEKAIDFIAKDQGWEETGDFYRAQLLSTMTNPTRALIEESRN